MRGKYESKILMPDKHFSYMITHSDIIFDFYSRKLMPMKGEKMEFTDMMKELDKELDLYYYFEKTIISLYVRFIIYKKRYEPTSSNRIMQIKDPDEKYKQIDDYTQKQAKLWLEKFIKENIIMNCVTFKMMESCRIAYKCAYKSAIKKVQEILY